MSGLSFLNTMFLAGLAVALVPLLIHLIQRRRIQQVVFGSVRFLRKMSHRVVRRRRFTEFLLILLRTAALAALALAFARPFFWAPTERLGAATLQGDDVSLLLIDNSYSMRLDGRLDRAKKLARDMVDKMDPNAKFGVCSFTNVLQPGANLGCTLAEARQAIDAIQPTWGPTDLAAALDKANSQLAERQEESRRIFLLSDFQKSAWNNKNDLRLSAGTVLSAKYLDRGKEVDLDVAGKDAPNVFLERVAVPRLVVVGDSVVLSARVCNGTDQPLKNAEVTLKLGDKVVEKRPVNILPGASQPVHFRQTFAEAGDVAGSITIVAADGAPADNTGYFSVHVTPQVRVLVVNGDPDPQLIRNDGFFLATALAPGPSSPFSARQIAPAAMVAADLDKADVVFFANVDQVPAPAAAALKKFLARGGGACFTCGAKMDADKFNACFGDVAPCKLWKTAMEPKDTPVVISQADLRHEIFAEFSGPHTGDLATAKFTQYFLVKDSQLAAVLARFSAGPAGNPALLEKAGKGKAGKCILFTSATDLEWNDLCLKSVFVPLLHQIATRLSAEQSVGERNLLVGETISLAVPPEAKVELTSAAGKKSPLAPRPAGGGQEVVFTPDEPGVYEVHYGIGVARFAVNLDGREPNLKHLDPRELVSAVQAPPDAQARPSAGVASLVTKGTARDRREAAQGIWWYLMAVVAVALAVEMVVAARTKAA